MDANCVPRDSVDALLASWDERRPELDFAPVGVISRLARVRGHVDRELNELFEAHGLSAANFGVLVTLARIGDERGVSQRQLMDELGLTSGTISVRMDRLVELGLIERKPDPESKRTTLITLTARGRELFERIVPAHLANERRLLAALGDDELQTLAGLLRKLLVSFEGSRPAAHPRLGLTLAPAHAAIALRDAVGLPSLPALLVRGVEADSPAFAAGLRTGDVLHDLRSIADLYAAIDAASGDLSLRVLRGVDELTVTVALDDVTVSAASTGRGARDEHIV
ncbi:MarR family transcriptional regulator [Solirubrobacter ginsenosidimutans]|uniref:MarR family transcriptional regulator n=1 Tax=Solirubrobacter ginsenosidimutans TaxID=490573 RepID=A0A9X3MTP6_9ACTN|nr:MarR family transcriptional regulator [Solirubrobacter ginsenosidimutans]MDA0161666.1 MarR family transcriptional regulator [Solirubrobacter ginsenosidimutans]